MGLLQHVNGVQIRPLRQRCIFGRSRACTHRLCEPDVSGEHALLRWTGGVWEVQDLHSRNGTFVDGRRLAPGERAALDVGARLGFGRPDSFTLVDARPPPLFAESLADRTPIEAHGGILALPGPSAPEVMVFHGVDGWVVERAGEATSVADGEILRIGGEAWQLHLPDPLPQTAESTRSAPYLDEITLRFRVSRDEEYIELVALHDARTIDLKARSHHYTLLMLARARLNDRSLAPTHQGWVYQAELLDLMRVDAGHLHLNIFRLRQQFDEAGIVPAAGIVERRTGTRQLRCGVARVEILPLAAGE
jgi:hypothetical protein